MGDYRFDNKYVLSFSNKFLSDFDLDKSLFIEGVRTYVRDFYLTNRPQMYSVNIGDTTIRFHKIDLQENNKSSQKWKRAIMFFVLNSPSGINTLYPAFVFPTQEEKIYNQKLKTAEFTKSLRLKLEKYNSANEYNIEL